MSMKQVLAAALATFAMTGVALAGEGNGDPFPGPDAVVREEVGKPNYTMGADAPFNYFYTARPTPLEGYHAAAGSSQDPFPFKASGQVIQVGPTPPSAVVAGPRPNTHG